jgi:ABC-type polysaccharide/polyol phosphate export permease
MRDLRGQWDLLWNLTLRELRSRYKRSLLGWAWSLLNPISTTLIFTFIYVVVFKQPAPVGRPSGLSVFPLFLLCGLLPWNFFANSVNGSISSIVGNGGLIKKVWFPRELLVYSTVISSAVTFFIEMTVLSAGLIIAGGSLRFAPLVLIPMLLMAVFAAGVGLVVSSLNVFFRDVGYLYSIVMQLWFYLTPIIYPESTLSGKVNHTILVLLRHNPPTLFVHSVRSYLYDETFGTVGPLLWLGLEAVVALAVGLFVFKRLEKRFGEEL